MKKAYAAVGMLSAAAIASMYLTRPRISLEDKVVLITGGSRGLGLALAKECARLGGRLFLVARNEEELERARQMLVDAGVSEGRVRIHPCDVRDAVAVEAAVAACGRVDVVINDAGIITVGPAESFTLADYVDVMQTNYFGALHTTLAAMPQMLARGEGYIVNIGSIGGKVPFPHLLPYVASKFALVGWSAGLRTELAPKGIQVTTVNPSVLSTGSHVQALFKGEKSSEFAWFASSVNNPLTATAADAAARTIVHGVLRGKPEIEIGLQAELAARLYGLSPSLSAAALGVANTLLPRSAGVENGKLTPGRELEGALPGVLQHGSDSNIEEHNQLAS